MTNQIRKLKMRIRAKLMSSLASERLSSTGHPQLHKNVWSLAANNCAVIFVEGPE
jgi:hypothetical protein